MNKYLAFFSFAALCFSLSEAATRSEVQGALAWDVQQARNEGTMQINTAARDTIIGATTPLQRICASRKIGLAKRDFNLEVENKRNALQLEINSLTPEQLESLDLESWSQKVNAELASAKAVAESWAQQIRQCA